MIRCSFVEPLMMESFSYNSEGKSIPYYEEVDFPVDVFARSRKVFPGWDRQCANSSQFIDLDLSELPRKPFLGTCSTTEMLYGGEIGADASKMLATTLNCFNASDLSLDSGSNHTNSSKDSNSPDPFQFDLKLGSLVDGREGKDVEFSNESFRFDSAGVAPLAKRARGMSSRAQSPPVCQVYGCNKDLSSSKNYHKKHKVCDAHSKSSKVIVKGIEQRFCQQCSRFHLLSEFDDGKRSCRKRLAGHNERRRKPQLGALNLKPDKLLQISQGTEFLGTSLGKRNIFLSNTPQGNIHNPESGVANGYTNIKLEEKSAFGSQLPIPMAYEPLLPNSFLHLGGTGRQCGTGIPPSTTESTIFGTGSYFDELAGFSNSSCALSLLSAESQGLSSFTENAVTKPLVSKTGSAYHMDASYMHLRLGAKYVADGSSGIDAVTINTIDPFVGYNTALAADLRVNVDGFTQESDFSNSKYHVSTEHESTMDLLQLSSHLQRVEQQRTIIQAKLETKDFTSCNFTYES